MLKSILWSVVGIGTGIATAMVFIIAVEIITPALWPFPEGADPHDIEACKTYCAALPPGASLLASSGWGLAVFLSSWVATRVGANRHPAHGIALGSLLFLAAVANMLMLPYPVLFWAANLSVLPVGLIAGPMLGKLPARPPADNAVA